jgi:hypothetical protein
VDEVDKGKEGGRLGRGEWKEGKCEENEEEEEVEKLEPRLRSATSVSRSRGDGEERGGDERGGGALLALCFSQH